MMMKRFHYDFNSIQLPRYANDYNSDKYLIMIYGMNVADQYLSELCVRY